MSSEELKYFFSYTRIDSEFVLKLAKELREAGVNLWLDQLDILGGQHWDSTVEEALKSCKVMIAVLSPESVASDNVMDEVSYALAEGKPVVPVLLRPCDIPFRLRRVQHIDFTADYDSGFSELLRSLDIEQPAQPQEPAAAREPDVQEPVAPEPVAPEPVVPEPVPSEPSLPKEPESIPDTLDHSKPTGIETEKTPKDIPNQAGADIFSQTDSSSKHDDVYLGVGTPKITSRGEEFVAYFAAYTEIYRDEVRRVLKQEAPSSQARLDLEICRWRPGTRVTVRLHAPKVEVATAVQTFKWNGTRHVLRFDVKVLNEIETETLILRFDIAVEGFPLIALRPELDVCKGESGGIEFEPISWAERSTPRSAFASYASKDRRDVLSRIRSLQIFTGIDVFLDCWSIRPGEQWKPTLRNEINARDIFLLFWSRNAKKSRAVEWEWKTALGMKSLVDIQPHPLEPVELAPPPEELATLQFGAMYEWYITHLRESRLTRVLRILWCRMAKVLAAICIVALITIISTTVFLKYLQPKTYRLDILHLADGSVTKNPDRGIIDRVACRIFAFSFMGYVSSFYAFLPSVSILFIHSGTYVPTNNQSSLIPNHLNNPGRPGLVYNNQS